MFSRLVGKKEDPEVRGYIETMLILALADGELEDDEIDEIIVTSLRHPKLKDMTHKEFDHTVRRSLNAMDKQGLEERLRAISSLLPSHDARYNAMDLAVSVAMSDGEMEPDEVRLLEKMQHFMGLSDAEIDRITSQYR